MSIIHRTKGKTVLRTYGVIPYAEFSKILKEDGEVFLEDKGDPPIKRQTVWRAAKKLTKMMGKKVFYDRALLQMEGADAFFEGYLFSIQDPGSPPQTDNAS